MNKFFLPLIALLFLNCQGQKSKINGISFVAAPQEISLENIDPLVQVNANWAAVMPFGFVKSLNAPDVIYNTERQWWGERRDGVKRTIEMLNRKGIKVMLKPQLWVWRGEFTGTIEMKDEQDWQVLEKSYEEFIMVYAELASELNVPLLCIGTELHTFVQKRTQFWHNLILRIREVYKGKLTYAENWDQFNNTKIWKKLDYIGIDAYFPLSDSKTPDIEELKSGWVKHKEEIVRTSIEFQKPILFTEYGYRSVDYTGLKPWDSHRSNNDINLKAQENALTAIHETFWKEEWFAGGFLWKWFYNHNEAGGKDDNRFTIQNKPSEELIRQLYQKEK